MSKEKTQSAAKSSKAEKTPDWYESQIGRYKAEIDAKQAENAAYKETIKALKQQVQSAESQRDKLAAELKSHTERGEKAMAAREESRQQCAELEKKARELQAELNEVRQVSKSRRVALNTLDAGLASIREKLAPLLVDTKDM